MNDGFVICGSLGMKDGGGGFPWNLLVVSWAEIINRFTPEQTSSFISHRFAPLTGNKTLL